MDSNYSNYSYHSGLILNATESCISTLENSFLANNTINKTKTISEELNYLDLASKSNPVAIEAKIKYLSKEHNSPKYLSKEYNSSNVSPNEKVSVESLQNNEEAFTIKSKKVVAYKKKEAQKLFNFKKNGFVFSSYEGALLEEIKAFKPESYSQGLRVLFLTQEILEKWAKKQGIKYDVAIPLALVHRSESKDRSSTSLSPVSLTHVDFAKSTGENETKDFMKAFKPVWKTTVENALDKFLTDEEFENIKIVQMVNIWMPLNDKPTENTLALMDRSRIKQSDLIPFSTSVGEGNRKIEFIGIVMVPSKKHQFVIQSDMKRGDMVIFDTLNTPHTAVMAPRSDAEKNLLRESIEIRAIFIQK